MFGYSNPTTKLSRRAKQSIVSTSVETHGIGLNCHSDDDVERVDKLFNYVGLVFPRLKALILYGGPQEYGCFGEDDEELEFPRIKAKLSELARARGVELRFAKYII